MIVPNDSIEIIKIKREAARKALEYYYTGEDDAFIKEYLDKHYPLPKKRRVVQYSNVYYRMSDDGKYIEGSPYPDKDFCGGERCNDIEWQYGKYAAMWRLVVDPYEPEEA